MKHVRLALISISALLTFTSCTTMVAEFPATRMDIPEAIGTSGKKIAVTAATANVHRLGISGDASSRPPSNLNSPSLDSGRDLMAIGALGLLPRGDISVKMGLAEMPTMVQAKYQILGQPGDEADPGNISLAVSAAIGAGVITRQGDQKGPLGPGGNHWETKVTQTAVDGALILGYRTDERTLIYGGGFITNIGVEGRIEHAEADDHSTPSARYESNFSGTQKGANLGFQYYFGQAPAYFMGEIVYSDVDLGSRAKGWQWGTGLAFGFYM